MKGRLVNGPNDLKDPGDYTLPMKGYTGELEASFFVLPNGHHGHITFPPHEYKIEEDGTLTVSPSILFDDSARGWHGYLRQGMWSE